MSRFLPVADELLLRSSRLDPAALRRHQTRQLALVLAHARATVPFYAARLRAARLDPERDDWAEVLRDLQPLTRAEAQEEGERLASTRPRPGTPRAGTR